MKGWRKGDVAEGSGAEWQHYAEQLRQANARKRRLLQMLDRLAARAIIEER